MLEQDFRLLRETLESKGAMLKKVEIRGRTLHTTVPIKANEVMNTLYLGAYGVQLPCVIVCVRACVRACVCVRVSECVCVCVCV